MADEITNRLGGCTSPYLLQHASNPVSWQPWDEEAIELAKKLDRPLLVSIGYAACHWCHVMEHESFNDEPTAKQMNESLVCIKVDREESPDVDALYMAACQIYSGGGGWPLNVFVDPDTQTVLRRHLLPSRTTLQQTIMGATDRERRAGMAGATRADHQLLGTDYRANPEIIDREGIITRC